MGPLLAAQLGWSFIDFDEEIERQRGQRVFEIFRQHGEAYFRVLEAELTKSLAQRHEIVLAPGGGWVTQPELVEMLRPGSLIVWLRVRPESVYHRHVTQANVERPLLDVGDPIAAIESLLTSREPLYERADAVIQTDDYQPSEVAAKVARMIEA